MKHETEKQPKDPAVEDVAGDREVPEPGPESPEAGEARLAEGADRPTTLPDAEPAIDYKDRWLRAEAELQTYRRRARREIEDTRRVAEESVLLDLVSWLDDLERAVDAAREAGATSSWVEGVSLLLQKGREYLERQGVTTVDPADQTFDPNFHEAILEVDAPKGTAPGTVVQVVHKGYRRGDRALRPARVVVARGDAGGA